MLVRPLSSASAALTGTKTPGSTATPSWSTHAALGVGVCLSHPHSPPLHYVIHLGVTTRGSSGTMDSGVGALVRRLADPANFASSEEADTADTLSQELIALQSIYGEDELQLLHESASDAADEGLVLVLRVSLQSDTDDVTVRLQIFLPTGYPRTRVPPRLQLLNRYVGVLKVPEEVHQYVASVFQPDAANGVVWRENESMLFEGIESVFDYIRTWYEQQCQGRPTREPAAPACAADEQDTSPELSHSAAQVDAASIVRSEPIVERKSEFLGHAARIRHPDDVPVLLSHILESDKRVQRATHPIIHAWVCRTDDGVLHHGM